MKDLLKQKIIKELLIDYDLKIIRHDDCTVTLYDKQFNETLKPFTKEELVNYFASDCEHRYRTTEDNIHLEEYNLLVSLLKNTK